MVSGHPSLRMLILAWGLSAAACAVIACTQLRVWPRLSRAVAWVHEHRGLSGFLLADYLVGTGAFQGGLLAVGAYLGTAEVGALRGAQVLVGPLGILAAAASTFLIPELSKRSDLRRRPRVKLAHGVSTALTMTSLAYTTVLVLLPGAVGTALLGDSWLGTDAVLLPVALGSCAAAMSLGPATLIYAAGRARQTFRLRVLEAPILTGCLLGGAHLAGATGAAWGICVNFLVMTPMWFHQGWRAVRPNGPSHRAVPPRPASPRPGAPRHAR
jgi:O-antigen/teichoic acid export membrane protein